MVNATQGSKDEGQKKGAGMFSQLGKNNNKKMLSGREDKSGKQCNKEYASDKIGAEESAAAVLTFPELC